MRNPLAIFMFCFVFLSGYGASAIEATERQTELIRASESQSSEMGREKSDRAAYFQIEQVLKRPQILTTSWPEMQATFQNCERQAGSGELRCQPMSGIKSITIQTGGAGIIDFELLPPITCSGLYDLVYKEFGAGEMSIPGDKCYAK